MTIRRPLAMLAALALVAFFILLPGVTGHEAARANGPGTILDTVMGVDADGNPTLYATTYDIGHDTTLIGVDPVTGDVRTRLKVGGTYGGYHLAKAPDDRIYLALQNRHGDAQLWVYDPETDLVELATTFPTGIMCFGVTVSEFTGKVYCGVHSGAGVYEYDPATGAQRLVTSTSAYPKGIVAQSATTLIVAQGTPASVVRVDIATGTKTELLPATYAGWEYAYNVVQVHDYFYVQLAGSAGHLLLQFDSSTGAFVGEITGGPTGMGIAGEPWSNPNDFWAVGPSSSSASGYSVYTVNSVTRGSADVGLDADGISGLRQWPVTIGGVTWWASIGSGGKLSRWYPGPGISVGGSWSHQLDLSDSPARVFGDLGVQVTSTAILDTVMGEDAIGNPVLYSTTYNAGADARLIGVDPTTGDVVVDHAMSGAAGAYHLAKAPDGKIYFGPLGTSTSALWVYDPQTDAMSVATTFPSGLMCFGVTVSSFTGKVYCGSHSGGALYEYDPTTQAQRAVTATSSYPKGLAVKDANTIYVAQGTPASVLAVDIATGATTELLPATYASYDFAYNLTRVGSYFYVQLVGDAGATKLLQFEVATGAFVGEVAGVSGMGVIADASSANDFWAIGASASAPGGKSLFQVDAATRASTEVGVDVDWLAGVRGWPVTIGGDTWYAGIGNAGLFGRWKPGTGSSTGTLWTQELDLPGQPASITALTTGPDGRIYGGTYETNGLFVYDPVSNTTEDLGNVAPGRTGEILGMATSQDRLFMASYINNVITVYDPAEPWNPGALATSNPRDIGPVGDSQNRPRDMTVDEAGRVWVASMANYGQLQGAISSIDPSTLATESYRGLAGGHQFFSIAASKGMVFAGSYRYGDGNTDAGSEAKVVVFDPDTESVAATLVPVAGASLITALETAADGTVYGAVGSTVFEIDPVTYAVTTVTTTSSTVQTLYSAPDGVLYVSTDGGILTLDQSAGTVTALTGTGAFGPTMQHTATMDADGNLYEVAGASLIKISRD